MFLLFFFLQGEICVASSRVFVQEGIYDEFIKKLEHKLKTWTVGDPFDPNVHQGPQVINFTLILILRFMTCFFQ